MIGPFKSIFKKIFGTANDREVRRYSQIVEEINAMDQSMQDLSMINSGKRLLPGNRNFL